MLPVLPFLSDYGWYVSFGLIVFYFLYQKYVTPIHKAAQYKEEEGLRKKYDHDWNRGKLKDIRERQQEHHNKVSEELKVQEEEKKKKRNEELLKELEESCSVLGNAIQKHEVREMLKKKPSKPETAEEFIDRRIKAKPIVMFSKSWCPFCRKLKSILATFRLDRKFYDYIELDEGDEKFGDQVQAVFVQRYGTKTVPKLFIGGNLIGGCDDATKLFQDGTLEGLIHSITVE
ncbi:hypothetical protein WR25_23435 [Diploscapter pachys]|uniref:Glutaredoxin domain-containing protein n=1 Tax=Diploscapter pachys TaxID=2018661 RepID=A0A2A2JMC9_9BILA|nr:hypothetical protein WR25_23435 [Diploscapter pachys]